MINRLSPKYRRHSYAKVENKYLAWHRGNNTEYLQSILLELTEGNHPSALSVILQELSSNPQIVTIPQIINYLIKHNHLEMALEIFEKSLGDEHPNTQTVAQNYTIFLGERGKLEEARKIMEKFQLFEEFLN